MYVGGGVELRRVVDDLGGTIIELRLGEIGRGMLVHKFVIFEDGDDPQVLTGALVLAVGLSDADRVSELLGTLAIFGATAVVVRSTVTITPQIIAAADASGLALLVLRPHATWEQLIWMLRALLAAPRAGIDPSHTVGGVNSGDLFALANVISTSLDAPVTIEDRESCVLAFSGRQDEADQSRIATILRRQVPLPLIKKLKETGILDKIYDSNEPVQLRADTAGGGVIEKGRVVVPVRAGSEVLGTIWVAVNDPLDEGHSQFLKDAARLAALHLLALRVGSDLDRSRLAEDVSAALDGGSSAAEALARLRIRFPLAVVAINAVTENTLTAEGAVNESRAALYRISDTFNTHLAAWSSDAVSSIVGDTVYAIIPVSPARPTADSAERIAADFLKRIDGRMPTVIGIGPVAHNISDLSLSRHETDRTLRAMASLGMHGQVANWEDLAARALLNDLGDLVAARGDKPTGPVARLQRYDAAHHNQLVATLELWLEAGCDLQKAAAASFCHPNTFRYRLKRVTEVGEIDLDDADDRFYAHLQLRLIRQGSLSFESATSDE
ncbi:MAG: PucR family transcriptional regulator [Comamonadaceae bacterium]|nr:MAG: PucR family transcriptional regulator [Comamonadaceae bacterium]